MNDGVPLVWVIDPRQHVVIIHTQGSKQQTRLTIEDTLDGGEVLPGFQIEFKDLFRE